MKQLKRITLRFAVFILLLFALWFLGKTFKIDSRQIEESLRRFSLLKSGAIFVIAYVVITFFVWFSKDAFRIASAVIFGANISSLLVFIAESINAILLFHFARYMGREFIKEKFLKNKFSEWDRRFAKAGSPKLFLMRVIPLIPFRYLDLFMGLSGISFGRYFAVVVMASPLRIYWLQFILAGAGKSFLNNPSYLIEYLLAHRVVFLSSLAYLALTIILAFKLRSKV